MTQKNNAQKTNYKILNFFTKKNMFIKHKYIFLDNSCMYLLY